MLEAPWLDQRVAANGIKVCDNFSNWFGASQIVDDKGAPMPLFHGTRSASEFDVFRPSLGGAQGPGIYFSNQPPQAGARYGVRTIAVYVAMQNPYIFHPSDDSMDAMVNPELLQVLLDSKTIRRVVSRIDRLGMDAYGDELTQALKSRGHDGIVVVYPEAQGFLLGPNVVIAMSPEQVKSADSNCGLYLIGSPSMSDFDAQTRLLSGFHARGQVTLVRSQRSSP